MSHHHDLDSYLRSSSTETDSSTGYSQQTARQLLFNNHNNNTNRKFKYSSSLSSCCSVFGLLFSRGTVNHSMAQAATSIFLSIQPFLIIRLAITAFFTMTIVLFTATADLNYSHFSAWVYALVWLTSILLCCASLRHLLSLESRLEEEHLNQFQINSRQQLRNNQEFERDRFSWLPNIVIPLRLTVLCSAAVVDIAFWLFLHPPYDKFKAKDLFIHCGNFIFPLLDFLLATPVSFPFAYVTFTAIFPAIWLIYAWIYYAISHSWSYPDFDHRQGVLRAISAQLGLVLMPFLIAMGVFFLNEITGRLGSPRPQEQEQSKGKEPGDIEHEIQMDLKGFTTILPVVMSEKKLTRDVDAVKRNSSSAKQKRLSSGREPIYGEHGALDTYGSARQFIADSDEENGMGPRSDSSHSSGYIDFDKYVSSQNAANLFATMSSIHSISAPLPVFVPVSSCCQIDMGSACRRSHSTSTRQQESSR